MTDVEPPAVNPATASLDGNVDVSTPAFVTWGSGNSLSDVSFDLRHISSTNNALFKLRITVVLKACAPSRTAIFLHIPPERILSLVHDDIANDQIAAQQVEARHKLGADLTCLRFALGEAPDLIGPKLHSLAPKNKASGDILDSLRSLACQQQFAIWFSQKALPKSRLVSLGELVSTGVLTTSSRQADLSSLYRGTGGEVIKKQKTSATVAAAASSEIAPPHCNPPSYNDLDPSPPSAPLDVHSSLTAKKRRRSSDDDIAAPRFEAADFENMCRKIVAEQKAEILQMMDEQHIRLYDRLLGELKPYISQELEKLETRILDQVDQKAGKQLEEQDHLVENHLDVLRDEVDATIDSRINDVDERVEDQFYGLRLRLEDFVKEEVTEAEQRIVEHLEGNAHISFS